ncbi:DUF6489 family protein [Motiliproteus sp. MSK22-1]|uniref:DUF6489 family protein n=1 Tax=Motiliproteus sp. MSK22-1 TaxID=1897630 RepID=UPI000977FB2F|nr:DUF6489 family protein [Motiliproteus sp. MSK22-1]OMH38713.1 hypothetical protein BGP75_05845 [Motiliproteus sp. MSK22-1]
MKVTIDLDITPEEMRKILGLPDVQEFQKELLEQVRAQVEAGTEGYDPMTLMKPYLPGSASMDQFQRMMMQMITSYTGADKKADNNSDKS